jgi:alkylation response protein AidB-like acyl-CoA dehydrogenase
MTSALVQRARVSRLPWPLWMFLERQWPLHRLALRAELWTNQFRGLTYRAAWLRDQGQRITQEAAMAKMTATENAQQIIDMAVQMHGGMGVKKGCIVESLYREIRALRIYEGATEVQQLIIGRDLLK